MKAIVLTTTLYSDNSYMVDLYTDEAGYAVASVKTSRRSAMRNSLLQPLSLLNVELSGKQSQRIRHISECSMCHSTPDIAQDIAKNMTAQFLAELLQRVLRNNGVDANLFAFIEESILTFDRTTHGAQNFHLVFLTKLTHYLGFFPNLEGFDEGVFFDMQEGRFSATQPLTGTYLSPEDTVGLAHLMRIDYPTMHLYRTTQAERNRILEAILAYYRLHTTDFAPLKTLEILRTLSS